MNNKEIVRGLKQRRDEIQAELDRVDKALAAFGVGEEVPTEVRQRKRHVFRSQFEMTCKRPGCGQHFKAKKRNAKWCSRECRSIANQPDFGVFAPSATAPPRARATTLIPGDTLTAGNRK